jgi:hypothetical protein
VARHKDISVRNERRRFPRAPVFLEVRAKHRDLPVIYAKGLDLSVGGICILSPEELPGGRVVELAMNIPPVIARGRVVWEEWVETDEGEFFQTGIQLTEIKPVDKATLKAFLHNIM